MKTSAPQKAEVHCVLRAKAIVGESPRWHSRERRLYWIDIQKKQVHRFNPETGRNESVTLPDLVTSLAFRKRGGLLLTLSKTFAFFDWDREQLEPLNSIEERQPDNRFNDGICDPQGRFWAGTMASKKWQAAAGNLYRLEPDLSVARVQSKLVCSNGCGWSPDGRTFYHTESFRYVIWAYDFDPATGQLSRKRRFAKILKASGGFPDGLTVDAEGGVWSNQVGLGQIVRYDTDGKIERTIHLPVPRATDCAFGGERLETLFITSARETMTRTQLRRFPLSGSLFAVRPGMKGLPSLNFAG